MKHRVWDHTDRVDDPHYQLVFTNDAYMRLLALEVRYKGPGLHITITELFPPIVLQGGDWTDINKAVNRQYNLLVEGRKFYQKA